MIMLKRFLLLFLFFSLVSCAQNQNRVKSNPKDFKVRRDLRDNHLVANSDYKKKGTVHQPGGNLGIHNGVPNAKVVNENAAVGFSKDMLNISRKDYKNNDTKDIDKKQR